MVLDVRAKYKEMLGSLVASIIIAIVVFFVLQGVIIDIIARDLRRTVFVESISVLTYIVFIYSFTLFFSLLVSSIILTKNKAMVRRNLAANIFSLIFTIVYISFVSFLFAGYGMRYYFNNVTLIDKIFGFYKWNSYFIAYILQSSTPYFFMLLFTYCYSYVLFATIMGRFD
jgi:hypothetical protein